MLQDKVSLLDKYSKRDGSIFISGVQSLVRMPLVQKDRDISNNLNTAGFISGYKGSPLAGYDLELSRAQNFLDEKSIFHQPGLNEEVAATSVWGSQQGEFLSRGKFDGVFGIWYGKGPGVDRAMDALKHANAAGSSKHGGVLAIAGDDHGAKSSTLPHQSDHNFISAFIPYLYPSGVNDIVPYGLLGIAMSRFSGCWIGMKIVSDVADAAMVYNTDLEKANITIPSKDFFGEYAELSRNIYYKDNPRDQDHRLQRVKGFAAQAFGRVNGIDKTIWKGPKTKIGIITSGKSYNDVREALRWLNIDESSANDLGVGLYKVGMPWPLEPEGIREFCEGLDHVLVVEEKRELIEHQIKWQLYNWKEAARPIVVGKQDELGKWLLPPENDLPLEVIVEVVAKRIYKATNSSDLLDRLKWFNKRHQEQRSVLSPINRNPYFCSGCPHNTSTLVPEGSRSLGGIGCHYMAVDMDRGTELYTQMGGEGTPWIGQSPFSKDSHIFANLGDGTYKHSGILAIRAAIDADINITYKILYNDAVAMTGGQAIGNNWDVQGITRQLLAEGISKICILSEDPAQYKNLKSTNVLSMHRDNIIEAQKDLKKVSGVSALIYDQTCAAEKRRRRKRGLLEDPIKRVFINPEICEGCGDCSIQSNCVSIEPLETSNGRKRKINQANCNKDYSCLKGFCPSFITADVVPKKIKLSKNFQTLLDPNTIERDETNIMLTGIGGTGVLTISALLGMAAHIEGKVSTTLDLTGLAQKGGAVWSHIKIFSKEKAPFSHKISPASTDLLLACDPVVAVKEEIQETFSKSKTYSVVNSSLSPVADFVKERDLEFMEQETVDLIKKSSFKLVSLLPASNIAARLSNDAIGSNLIMLGAAFQAGLIPLKRESIEEAIILNKVGAENNLHCFNLGRAYVQNPQQPIFANFLENSPDETLELVLSSRKKLLKDYGRKEFGKYNSSFSETRELLKNEIGSESTLVRLAKELYRLLAIKDEYQVAEFHLQNSKELISSYGNNYFNLNFYLAPPLLSFIKDKKTQRPKKFKVPAYIALPTFYLLRSLKFLRGSPLDIMKHSKDRKLALEHQKIFFEDLANISTLPEGKRLSSIAKLLSRSEKVKGFGPVREIAFKTFLSKE
ncbi:indolepyruvate ferredoxin oxidoreductase family protein [Gammaproteobacteria bacterium]|nr:indolepyruvate ferredoxin oxidoreductase family protein [Gammaproteobacteria bacterium]